MTIDDRELQRRYVEAIERIAEAFGRSSQEIHLIRRVLEREEARAGSARVCAQQRARPPLRVVR